MSTLASLNVVVGADIRNYEAGMGRVGDVLKDVDREARSAGASIGGNLSGGFDKAANAADSAAASFANTTRNFRAIGASISSVGEGFTKFLTLPITLLGTASIKAFGDLQALEKGFNAVYKGAGPAADELARLKDVAKLPGLGLKEAYQGSINLQAVGFSAEQSRKTLAAFGNALATVGKGKADLDGVTLALTQIASKGKISAEELNQIAERVPQIRKVLTNVFGTADTEQLAKLGIGAEEFVSKVTTELGKLPQVTGGINNAIENGLDSAFNRLSKIGASLQNAFNVEGLINGFFNAFDKLGEAFDGLSPDVQKVIFVFAGLAAAAGPVLLAIGGIVSALPVLTAGFAVITGPIGIAAAAIAAAAYLIITNWDSVVAYFQSSGISSVFSDLATSVQGAFNSLIGYVQDFAAFVKPVWDGIVEIFGTGLGEGLRFAGTVLSAGFDLLKRILNVGGAVLRGDWSKVWEGLGNVVIAVLNGITRILTKFFSGTIKVFGSIAKAVGNDTLSKSFASGAASVEAFGNSLLKAYLGTEKVAASAKKVADTVKEIPSEIPQDFARTPKTAKGKAAKKETVKEVDLNYHLSTTGFKKQIADIEKQQDKVGNGQGFEVPIKLAMPQNVAEEFSALTESIRGQMTNLGDVILETTPLIQQGLTEAFTGVADLIGGLVSGNVSGAAAFFNGILTLVLDFVGQFGKALLAAGIGALQFQNLLLNPPAAIAAGVALIALSGAVKGLLKKGPGKGASASTGGGSATGSRPSYTSPANGASYKGAETQNNVELTTRVKAGDLEFVLRQNAFNKNRVG